VGFFRGLGARIQNGRDFSTADLATTPSAGRTSVIVNSAFVQYVLGGGNPIGRHFRYLNAPGQPPSQWFEIVGVVGNVRSLELREAPTAELYFSSQQDLWPAMSLVVRSNVEPASLSAAVRQAVNEVDRSVPVADVKTMEHIVSESITQPRFNLFLLGLFSAVAMVLSAAGIYGVTAYTVTQRTHEVGIRIALGAQVTDVLRMILGQGMAVIGVGLVVGLAAAFGLMRLLRSLLFGVGENDPLTFVAITVGLILVALIACYIPARRATKVDPLVALRAE
jgi:putative ABC transport system permease protein